MKNCQLKVKIAVFLFLILGLSTVVFAELKITVRGKAPFRRAEIKVFLNEDIYYGGKNKIKFQAKGLEPQGVYTVWLIKSQSMTGLGKPPYAFFADSMGRATYISNVEAHKLGSWQTIKIVNHKDSAADNMDKSNLVTVFLIDLKQFLSGKGVVSESPMIKPKISVYKGPLPTKPKNPQSEELKTGN